MENQQACTLSELTHAVFQRERRGGSRAQLLGANLGLNQLLFTHRLIQLKAAKKPQNLLIIADNPKEFRFWHSFVSELSRVQSTEGALFFGSLPEQVFWGHEQNSHHSALRRDRLQALRHLKQRKGSGIIVTTLAGLAQLSLSPEELVEPNLELQVGCEYDFDALGEGLIDLGYLEVSTVEEPGSFSRRGGVYDIFPADSVLPVRASFFVDELETLRLFHPDHQRSISELKTVSIGLAYEGQCHRKDRSEQAQSLYDCLLELDVSRSIREGMLQSFREGYHFASWEMFLPLWRKKSASGFSYLDSQDCLVFPQTEAKATAGAEAFFARVSDLHARDRKAQRPVLECDQHFLTLEMLAQKVCNFQSCELGNPVSRPDSITVRVAWNSFIAKSTAVHDPKSRFDAALELLKTHLDQGYQVALVIAESGSDHRLLHLLEHKGFKVIDLGQPLGVYLQQFTHKNQGELFVTSGYLAHHVLLKQERVLLMPESEFFGEKKRKSASPSKKLQNFLSTFRDLKIGDLVVHMHHGIGRYLGLQTITVASTQGDYLHLEYARGDKVYLPVDKLSLLQRYQSADGASPTLDRLKSQAWQKRKNRVKHAVRDMADQLIKLQAQRSIEQSYAYSAVGEEYEHFAAAFPFEETPDQLQAIKEVNEELDTIKAMDRLICGDVGFGKTEIALRAAFRVVLDHRQVMVLVPTTILCFQHFKSFEARMGNFGVSVAQLNRFVDRRCQQKTLQAFSEGKIDVLIGTHRLLSKDILPRRLGLLIVDEEQRFGVVHKEALKELSVGVDVLTMTATPIPRTLHMAMLGLRDISLIATPPPDRLAVKTYVVEFEEDLLKQAVYGEVQRGGQVFFVHNRVEDIVEITNFLKNLLPNIRVAYAHGQMHEMQLEKIILSFVAHEFDVLVCTTIIESGIDMPNVNTLIVNHAERFGLAQLYQLRGRVGRSSRQAYAYLFSNSSERISDEARKRLEVLTTYQDLGSGFQIASHDLELRGAGNLLGAEQSGHVTEIGLELYTDMLETAISELRGGQVTRERFDPEIKLNVTAMIPESYVNNTQVRLHFYKSLFSASSPEEIDQLTAELNDRFGPLPLETQCLVAVARIRLLLVTIRAVSLTLVKGQGIELRFDSLTEAQIDKMIETAVQQPKRYRLTPDYRLIMQFGRDGLKDGSSIQAQLELLRQVNNGLEPFALALTSEEEEKS